MFFEYVDMFDIFVYRNKIMITIYKAVSEKI